jgi:hypothetical protein
LSDEKLKEFMTNAGITGKGKQKKALTVLYRWFEQQCLYLIFTPILDINRKGPIPLIVGDSRYRSVEAEAMVVFGGFIGTLRK